ncbi:MAG: PEP-CTERM sorting domain-containing protein [Planctomycetota bacterium]|jgi:hypothetical protein|nr:PEP-CTERM sorting domain-containing protein [Planctomycetota bacterium]MDP6761672.1 PEP-CTERM sorting domain-containing protein [Planctomycetota bacterium]MDP6990699.1 PEP-CTERM sorting domain-containing protein [Planctomycetota bacterium]
MKAPTALFTGILVSVCAAAPSLAAPPQQTKYSGSQSGTKVPTHSPEPLTMAALAGGAALGLAAHRRKRKQS